MDIANIADVRPPRLPSASYISTASIPTSYERYLADSGLFDHAFKDLQHMNEILLCQLPSYIFNKTRTYLTCSLHFHHLHEHFF